MKVSIVLATYNGRAFLAEQLGSFVSQTRRPDELVVVDDQSSDGTPDLVSQFARTAPFPVRLFVNERNLGHGQNFGRGLSLATGDLVFLSDQDDVWFDCKIERMVEVAGAHPDKDCFMNDAVLADRALASNGITKLQQLRAAGLPETSFVMGCCTAIRRRFLDIGLPIPANIHAHDTWLIGLSDGLARTHRHNEPLQAYRRHGRNVSNLLVNSVQRVNRLQSRIRKGVELMKRLNSGQVLDFDHRLHSALADRISGRSEDLVRLAGVSAVDAFSRDVVRRRDVLRARTSIRRMTRLRRPLPIARLISDGGYSGKAGWLGALKDLVITAR